MADKGPGVRLGTKLIYGVGSAAYGIKDAGFNTFLLIFYNQVLGVPATLVSLAIMIALIGDALFDPVIGQISDNWRSSLGRRHPFMYGAALPVAFFYLLLWNPPHWTAQALFFYVLMLAVLVRISIACYEIPSTALAPELSSDYDGRTSLMSYRLLFNVLGNGGTVAAALIFFMVKTKEQPTAILNVHGYRSYSIMAALLMATSILVSAAGTHSRISTLRQLPPQRRTSLSDIVRQVFESLSHRSFLAITVASLFGGVALGLVTALGTYFGTYFWKFTPQQLSALGLGALIAAFLSVGLSAALSKIVSKKNAYLITGLGSLFVNNITMTLKLLGLMPPDGSNRLLAVFFTTVTIGLALAIASFVFVTSMIADVVEDSELRTGRRSEGLFSAAISFVAKGSSGFGVLTAGLLIDFVHFPMHASQAGIDPQIVRNLALIYMPVQLTLFVIAAWFLSFYRIDRTTHEHNLQKLADAAATAEGAEEGVVVSYTAEPGALAAVRAL